MSMPLSEGADIGPLSLKPVWLLVNAVHLTREVSYGALVLLIWDMCLTFADEVDLIWSAKWSITSVLFLVNRYVVPVMIFHGIWNMTGLARNLSDNWCQTWLLVNLAMQLLCLKFVTLSLALRLNFAWASQFAWSVLVIWVGGVIASLITWVFVLYTPRKWIYYEERFNVCFVLIPEMWKFHVGIAVEHLIFLVVLIAKSLHTPRTADTTFLRVLLADGIRYFTVTLGASLFSVLSWSLAGDAYSAIPLYTVWIMSTIVMSRLLLNLQSHNTGSVEEEAVGGILLVDTHSTSLGRSSSFTAVNSQPDVSMVDDIEKGDEGKPLSHRKSNSRDEWGWLPNFPYLHHDQNRDREGSIFTAPYASSSLIPPSIRTAYSGERRRRRKYKPRSAKSGRLRVVHGGDTTDPSASYDEGFTTGSGGVTSGGEWSEVSMDRRRASTLPRNPTTIKLDIRKPTALTFDLSTEPQRRERGTGPGPTELADHTDDKGPGVRKTHVRRYGNLGDAQKLTTISGDGQ